MKITKRFFIASALELLALKGGWDLFQALIPNPPHEPSIPLSESNLRITRQVEATRLAILASSITRGFDELHTQYHLYQLATSVCRVRNLTKGNYKEGSGVLLTDKLIALCEHETFKNKNDDLLLSFFSLSGDVIKTVAKIRHIDREHDVVIAELIYPHFTIKNSLIPVTRKDAGYYMQSGQPVVYLGYLDNKLHAVEGKVDKLVPYVQTDAGLMACKTETVGEIRIWAGMSGGGVFGADGVFMGMINAGSFSATGSNNYFTPAPLIWSIADALYNSILPLQEPQTPETCRLHRRNFLTLGQ